jgi:hypothetical protein
MAKPPYVRLRQLQKLTSANLTASAVTLSELRHGDRQLVRLNLAAGQTFTLPFSTGKGGTYRMFVQTTITGTTTVNTNASNNPKTGSRDKLYGQAVISSAGTPGQFAGSVNNTLTMNGSTQGGLIGSYVEFEDVAPGVWRVKGALLGSGIAVTPFS